MLDYETLSDAQLFNMSQKIDFFTYELDFLALTHATTAQSSFTIQTDSSFLWMYGTFQADIAAAAFLTSTAPVPNVTCTIQDTSSGRQLMSGPVPIGALFGAPGQIPYRLPTARFFRANTQLTLSLTNYDAAVDYNIRLQFHGMKRYSFNSSTA